MSVDMEQFHQVFFDESQEHLETMERLLMEIDLATPDAESLNCIFRAAHSIKGGSGIFGFDGLTGLTHVMENLLDKARNGQRLLSVEIVDQLLQTVDVLKSTLDSYRSKSPIDTKEIEHAVSLLEHTIDAQSDSQDNEDTARGYGFFNKEFEEDQGFGFFDQEPSSESDDENNEGFGFFDEPNETPKPAVNQPATTATKMSSTQEANELIGETPIEKSSSPQSSSKSSSTESKSIRVDTNKVDLLVNLIGELVITQSMLAVLGENKDQIEVERLNKGLGELERNTRELQEAVMSMRMLPISFVFNRFPRLVRDLAAKLGKHVDLVIEGGATEIDKGLVEKLVDPLTHLVRNSIDHGVEMPDAREAAGKPEKGIITLSASQRGGSIVISIRDDGAGLNKERILSKAKQNGIHVPDINNDDAIWHLIFAPGFSTANEVTDISGRGVGMDVVRRNIESMGGRIAIESFAGKGSAFHISVPLTLAIVDGMCVASGEQVFVVPLVNIIESIQPEASQLRLISNENLLWVRDKYWPILDLSKKMEIEGAIEDPSKAIVILIESSKKRFGLKVDKLLGQQQVVIKSLEQHYRRVPGAAGATIMGDGHVALILDVESLAEDIKTDIAQESLT